MNVVIEIYYALGFYQCMPSSDTDANSNTNESASTSAVEVVDAKTREADPCRDAHQVHDVSIFTFDFFR